jgi:uncharacterized cupredoxin-like copper-binding protein
LRFFATGVIACAVMAAIGYGSARPSSEDSITIRIEHSRFTPGQVEVEAGESMEFVIVNSDPIDHEFIVGDQSVQDVHERGTESEHDARPTEVSVPAGSTVRTTITFPKGGSLAMAEPLLFGCHVPGHYAYGMRGAIEVSG